MKKVFVALTLMLFTATVASTAYAATNGDGTKTEVKKEDKKKKKKKSSCSEEKSGEAKSCASGKSCCSKK